jgi:hypothetical protein
MKWKQSKNSKIAMGAHKSYLLNIISLCSDQQFGQDAVEWAITTGRVTLTYDLDKDLQAIMGDAPDQPADTIGKPETNYDRICAAYREQHLRTQAQLAEVYENSGLLEEILRPIPCHVEPISKAA